MASVNIPEELFSLLCRKYILGEDQHDPRIGELVEEKYESWARRRSFTDYRTAKDPQEREAARQRYLDSIGISADWRW